jgi:hypothetical protein
MAGGRRQFGMPSASASRLSARATVALAAAAAIVVLLVVAGLAAFGNHKFSYYSIDPADTLGGSPIVGLMSYVGVLMTWGAAVLALFVGLFLVWLRGWSAGSPLVVLGAGLAYFAADDLFLLHERIYPDQLGIPEELVLAVYAVGVVAFFWVYRDFFRRQELPLLLLAVGVSAAAIAIDVEARDLFVYESLKRWAEDGVKLFGLAFLAAYVVRLCARMLVDAYVERSTAADTTAEAP